MSNMSYKFAAAVGLKKPMDGYTVEEKVIEKLLIDNTIQSLYAKLPSDRMRFIVCAHFELGYPQEMIANVLKISQPSLNVFLEVIRMVYLGKNKKYNPRKPINKKLNADLVIEFFNKYTGRSYDIETIILQLIELSEDPDKEKNVSAS